MDGGSLTEALSKLQGEFADLDWTYHDVPIGSQQEKMFKWPGPADKQILIVVHRSSGEQELFHRHDFFYFNYTYKGQYDSLSYKYDNRITIQEGDLYAGQPFAGHALCVHDNQDTIIIGVLIQQEVFFRFFLPMISADSSLFHFFLDPTTNSFSEEFIHFKLQNDANVRNLLEMMAIEYANDRPDTQDILKPLVLAFLVQVARQYKLISKKPVKERLSEQIAKFISEHYDTVTLKDVAKHFSYHPSYISTLLHRELGKSFSQLLLEMRMDRAATLLKNTTLHIDEIALMLGYSNNSNFHKAFRGYYGCSPREYATAHVDAGLLRH